MTKKFLGTLIGLIFIAAPAFAETTETGNVILPVLESSYTPNPSVSLIGGSFTNEGSSASVVGVELAIDCPLFQAASGNIRQQISYSTVGFTGSTVSLIELNPHWMTEVADNLTAGFGPGLGIAQTSVTGGSSSSDFSVGIGASATYKMDSLRLGTEWRSMNGSRFVLKAGLSF